MEYFWKKKTIAAFILSIFVFWIHISSFGQYLVTSGQGAQSGSETFVRYLDVFFSDTFVRMAVPLFFILSGAALFRDYDNKKYKTKLKARVWSLLVPYLIWNTIGMLFSIVTSYTFISQYFSGREKFVITLPNILKAIFFYECNGPFWFICALIVFVLLSPLFELLTKKKITGILVFIVLVIVSRFEIPDFEIPYLKMPFFSTLIHGTTLTYGTDSLIYYLAGCILGRHFLKQFSEKCPKYVSICSLCVFILCTAAWFIRGIGIFELPAELTVLFFVIFALSFWYALDIFAVGDIRIRPFMNDNLFIYAMHVNLSAVIAKLLYMALPKSAIWSIPNFIVTSVLTVSLILLLAAFLRRFANPVYRLLAGKFKGRAAR